MSDEEAPFQDAWSTRRAPVDKHNVRREVEFGTWVVFQNGEIC